MEPPECDEEIVKKALKEEASDIYTFLEKIRHKTADALRERSREDIVRNIDRFVTIKDGNTIIACGEIFQTENTFTIELGALATDPEYKGQGYSDRIIEYAEKRAKKEKMYLMLVTNNPALEKKLTEKGYTQSPIRYTWRLTQSPTKNIYVKY